MVRGKVAAGSLCCPFGTSPDRATVRTRRQRERDDALLSAELPQTAVNEPDQAAVGTSTIPMQSTVDSMQSTIHSRFRSALRVVSIPFRVCVSECITFT